MGRCGRTWIICSRWRGDSWCAPRRSVSEGIANADRWIEQQSPVGRKHVVRDANQRSAREVRHGLVPDLVLDQGREALTVELRRRGVAVIAIRGPGDRGRSEGPAAVKRLAPVQR